MEGFKVAGIYLAAVLALLGLAVFNSGTDQPQTWQTVAQVEPVEAPRPHQDLEPQPQQAPPLEPVEAPQPQPPVELPQDVGPIVPEPDPISEAQQPPQVVEGFAPVQPDMVAPDVVQLPRLRAFVWDQGCVRCEAWERTSLARLERGQAGARKWTVGGPDCHVELVTVPAGSSPAPFFQWLDENGQVVDEWQGFTTDRDFMLRLGRAMGDPAAVPAGYTCPNCGAWFATETELKAHQQGARPVGQVRRLFQGR